MKGKRTISEWLLAFSLVVVTASIIVLLSAWDVNGEDFAWTMNHTTETIVLAGVTEISYEEASRIQSLNFQAWIAADTDTNATDKIAQIKNPDGWNASDSENILSNIY